MRKTKRIATKIQCIISSFVFFMSVFFCAGMHVNAMEPFLLESKYFEIYMNGNQIYDGPSNKINPYEFRMYQVDGAGNQNDNSSFHRSYFSTSYDLTFLLRFVGSEFDFSYFYFIYPFCLSFKLDTSGFTDRVHGFHYSIEPVGSTANYFSCYSTNSSFYIVPVPGMSFYRERNAYIPFNFRVTMSCYSYYAFGVDHYWFPVIFTVDLSTSFENNRFLYPVYVYPGTADEVTDGYKNGSMGSASTDLNNSLSGYEQAENNLFTSANQGVGSFQFQKLDTPALISSMSFVSTFLQSIYTSSGGLNGLGLLPAVVFTFTFASIVVGLYRYYGGGKSG